MKRILSKLFWCYFLCGALFLSQLPLGLAYEIQLPPAGKPIYLSSKIDKISLRGIKVNPSKPFQWQVLLDGDADISIKSNDEAYDLIRFFMACLTIPEKDLWVNLSPYENKRIIPFKLGQTGLGLGLLAQDYILKQISASLIDPRTKLGKTFWNKVYQQANAQMGQTDLKINTHHKVWILTDPARLVVSQDAAYIVQSHLKVMLDEDIIAEHKNQGRSDNKSTLTRDIYRSMVLPIIEKEVNEGEHFALLRQMHQAFILAAWYKRHFANLAFSQQLLNHNHIAVINEPFGDVSVEDIYQRYVKAYQRGAVDFVEVTGKTARRYFSGGTRFTSSNDKEVRLSDIGSTEHQSLSKRSRAMMVNLEEFPQERNGPNQNEYLNYIVGHSSGKAESLEVPTKITDLIKAVLREDQDLDFLSIEEKILLANGGFKSLLALIKEANQEEIKALFENQESVFDAFKDAVNSKDVNAACQHAVTLIKQSLAKVEPQFLNKSQLKELLQSNNIIKRMTMFAQFRLWLQEHLYISIDEHRALKDDLDKLTVKATESAVIIKQVIKMIDILAAFNIHAQGQSIPIKYKLMQMLKLKHAMSGALIKALKQMQGLGLIWQEKWGDAPKSDFLSFIVFAIAKAKRLQRFETIDVNDFQLAKAVSDENVRSIIKVLKEFSLNRIDEKKLKQAIQGHFIRYQIWPWPVSERLLLNRSNNRRIKELDLGWDSNKANTADLIKRIKQFDEVGNISETQAKTIAQNIVESMNDLIQNQSKAYWQVLFADDYWLVLEYEKRIKAKKWDDAVSIIEKLWDGAIKKMGRLKYQGGRQIRKIFTLRYVWEGMLLYPDIYSLISRVFGVRETDEEIGVFIHLATMAFLERGIQGQKGFKVLKQMEEAFPQMALSDAGSKVRYLKVFPSLLKMKFDKIQDVQVIREWVKKVRVNDVIDFMTFSQMNDLPRSFKYQFDREQWILVDLPDREKDLVNDSAQRLASKLTIELIGVELSLTERSALARKLITDLLRIHLYYSGEELRFLWGEQRPLFIKAIDAVDQQQDATRDILNLLQWFLKKIMKVRPSEAELKRIYLGKTNFYQQIKAYDSIRDYLDALFSQPRQSVQIIISARYFSTRPMSFVRAVLLIDALKKRGIDMMMADDKMKEMFLKLILENGQALRRALSRVMFLSPNQIQVYWQDSQNVTKVEFLNRIFSGARIGNKRFNGIKNEKEKEIQLPNQKWRSLEALLVSSSNVNRINLTALEELIRLNTQTEAIYKALSNVGINWRQDWPLDLKIQYLKILAYEKAGDFKSRRRYLRLTKDLKKMPDQPATPQGGIRFEASSLQANVKSGWAKEISSKDQALLSRMFAKDFRGFVISITDIKTQTALDLLIGIK